MSIPYLQEISVLFTALYCTVSPCQKHPGPQKPILFVQRVFKTTSKTSAFMAFGRKDDYRSRPSTAGNSKIYIKLYTFEKSDRETKKLSLIPVHYRSSLGNSAIVISSWGNISLVGVDPTEPLNYTRDLQGLQAQPQV